MDDVMASAVDLGHGVRVVFTAWNRHDKAGLLVEHPCGDDDNHISGIMFDLPGVAEAFPDRPLWELVTLDPLTVRPSLKCRACGHHGWITDGRWEPC